MCRACHSRVRAVLTLSLYHSQMNPARAGWPKGKCCARHSLAEYEGPGLWQRPPTHETLPWAPRTPNNPTEATFQSEYIKSQIATHQNSSSTSIYNAIDYLSKWAHGTMHGMILLRNEVRELLSIDDTTSSVVASVVAL